MCIALEPWLNACPLSLHASDRGFLDSVESGWVWGDSLPLGGGGGGGEKTKNGGQKKKNWGKLGGLSPTIPPL